MAAAMRNERLAARQKLADAYRVQLSVLQARLQQYWRELAGELDKSVAATSAPAVFAKCVESGLVDGVVIFDERGRVSYPNAPSAGSSDFGELEPKWQEASQLEYLRQYPEAAKRYEALGRGTTSANAAGRAFQSEARCLVQAGHRDAAIQVVSDVF